MFPVILGLEVSKRCFPVDVCTSWAKLAEILSAGFNTEVTFTGVDICPLEVAWVITTGMAGKIT